MLHNIDAAPESSPPLTPTSAGSPPPGDSERAREEQRVLSAFFERGRLRALPRQEKKRVVVLRFITEAFQLGRAYSEGEVNSLLLRFHDDYCLVRRELVDRGYLGRCRGEYWRGR
jgi:hypothetical protein